MSIDTHGAELVEATVAERFWNEPTSIKEGVLKPSASTCPLPDLNRLDSVWAVSTGVRWWAVLVAFICVIAVGPPSWAQETARLQFELEDQFREIHRSSDFLGDVVILIGSDKKGVQFIQGWGQAIHKGVADHPRYDRVTDLPYANLRGVPFFLKGTIRGKFPQEKEKWVLMDWKGAIAKSFDFVPGSANVLVFAPDGTLVLRHSGTEPVVAAVAEIVAAIRKMLDEIR